MNQTHLHQSYETWITSHSSAIFLGNNMFRVLEAIDNEMSDIKKFIALKEFVPLVMGKRGEDGVVNFTDNHMVIGNVFLSEDSVKNFGCAGFWTILLAPGLWMTRSV